jgi:GIY-YIG catalytic domain/Cytochrome C and Quinol oxidase polypeptide I/NUMOD1 domain
LLLVLSFILNYKLRLLQVTKEKREFSTNEEIENKNLALLSLKEPTEWQERWFLSSNAKDIGTLYLIFALFSGLIGTAFSVLIRLELSAPGVQYVADNQLYNSIITAHAIMMIFFMVKLKMLNLRSYSLFNKINTEYSDILIDGGNNKNSKHKYTKILVDDPFNNRDIILKITKRQKGVYIWESLDGKQIYVGHSINLYNRISSYFMPSILNTKARRVLRYLNKYGFSEIKLYIYIMDEKSTLEEVVELEQHFIDSLNPNLNVDLIASNSGYHEPMSQEMRDKLRKQRGIPVYVYKAEDFTLLYIFDSKQHTYDSINIHHKTLNDCLNLGTLYLDVFFLSLDLIEESPKTNILNLEDLKILVNNNKEIYKVKHHAAKTILAEFKDENTKNLTFNSLNSLANHLKGDRQVIREYLKGNKSSYYRGKWKFTYQ